MSVQLRDLSEISETLTLRLLELEERLAGLEGTLEALCRGQQAEAEGSDAVLDLLEQTENRISRLEGLLESGVPSGSTPREAFGVRLGHPPEAAHLQLLPLTASEDPAVSADSAEDPFPEDGEQPFMDELTA